MADSPADLFLHRALAAWQAGEASRAETLCRLGLRLESGDLRLTHLLAEAVWRQERPDEAVPLLRAVVAGHPGVARLYVDLGNALAECDETAGAVAAWRTALEIEPDRLDALLALAAAAASLGRLEEAAALLDRTQALAPESPEVPFHRGRVAFLENRPDEAEACFRETLRRQPDSAQGLTNLGVMLKRRGDLAGAIACHEAALRHAPDLVEAHWNLSHALLTVGEYRRGFAEAEWRLRRPETRARFRHLPVWQGEPLAGRRILLYAEQGAGDVINFARYVPMVAARGGRVVLECHAGLERLMATVAGASEIITIGRAPPPVDVCAPLLSLPHLFDTGIESVPAGIPYLSVPPGISLALPEGGFRVGLVWSGNPEFIENRDRRVPLRQLAALADIAGVRLFSLQMGPPRQELAEPGAPAGLVDLSPHLTDFACTAAAIAQLDLMVTVDTSVAHLAGALAAPTWCMVGAHCDWRWLRDRQDCPWYPTMRLFRQTRRGDWGDVAEAVAVALREAAWPRLSSGE